MNKLQYLLITELMKNGSVELLLPDGIVLQVNIMQEDKAGDLKKSDNYCSVVATRDGRTAILDSYNLGLQFEAEDDIIIYEDEDLNEDGNLIRSLDVV